MPAETFDTPVVAAVPVPVAVVEANPAEQSAPRWKRPMNNAHSDSSKSALVKSSLSSEHAPSRLVYSRDWLLAAHKNYAAPSGFNSGSAAFHDASQLPVALLPLSHDVRSPLYLSYIVFC